MQCMMVKFFAHKADWLKTTMEYQSLWEQRGMYQRKVDLDMLNAVKIKSADISSISSSSEQRWDSWLINTSHTK